MNDKRRKDIRNIIGQMFEQEKEKKIALARNKKLALQLKKYGMPVLNIIIEDLKTRKSRGNLSNDNNCGQPIFHLLMVVNKFANAEHGKLLAEILLWDEILFDSDRSARGMILATLQEIGNHTILAYLEQYAEKIPQIKYRDNVVVSAAQFQAWDKMDVNEAINSIRIRGS